jgi:hypothetical protein
VSESYTDQPPPHDPRRDEEYSPTRSPGRHYPEDPDVPSAPRLGSLAQKARGKQLGQARAILIVIGILTVIFNLIDLVALHSQVSQLPAQALNTGFVVFAYGLDLSLIALGILFVVFGVIIYRFPVPVTVLSLVLYILGTLVTFGLIAAVNPAGLGAMGFGIIIRIAIIVGLVKAVQSALAYERERREQDEYGAA